MYETLEKATFAHCGTQEAHNTIPELSYSADKLFWRLLPFGQEAYEDWFEVGDDAYDHFWGFTLEQAFGAFLELEAKGFIELANSAEEREQEPFSAIVRVLPIGVEKVISYLNRLHQQLREQEALDTSA